MYDYLLLGLRLGLSLSSCWGTKQPPQQRVSVISPIGTLTNTLPVKKSGRVNIIPIGDKIMPGEHIDTQTKINAVPGDSVHHTRL